MKKTALAITVVSMLSMANYFVWEYIGTYNYVAINLIAILVWILILIRAKREHDYRIKVYNDLRIRGEHEMITALRRNGY